MKRRIAAMVLAGAVALSLAPAYGVTEVKADGWRYEDCNGYRLWRYHRPEF